MHTYQNEKDASVLLDNAVLYPNPYITVTSHGYTKHYYMNGERLATSIGEGGWCTMSPDVISNPGTPHEDYLLNVRLSVYKTDDPFEYEKEDEPVLTQNVDINDTYQDELQYECPMRHLRLLDIAFDPDLLYYTMHDYCNVQDHESDIFYRHSDHLGSANWITDANGSAIQYMHYLPYGQLLVNQAPYLYDERYKFTGKERDAETGYDYFGARFYSSQLLHWISVDPLADKYPWISPYAYTAWNPIRFVDPDGGENVEALPNPQEETKQVMQQYSSNASVIHLFAHGQVDPHGNFQGIQIASDGIKKSVLINTAEQFNQYLLNCSVIWKERGDDGAAIIVLHACATGQGDDPIAQLFSSSLYFKNVLIVAPSDNIRIMSDKTEDVPAWNMYLNGKKVNSFDGKSRPVFRNPQKQVEKYLNENFE